VSEISSGMNGCVPRNIEALAAENERLSKIYELGNKLRGERNIDKLLPIIMQEISRFLNADRTTLFLIDFEKKCLWTRFAEGMGDDRIVIGMKMGLVGSCVLTKQPINVTSACDAPYFNDDIDRQTGYRTESVLCAPFFDGQRDVTGAVELINKKKGIFTKEDERRAEGVAAALSNLFLSDGGTEQPDWETARKLTSDLRAATDSERSTIFFLDRKTGDLRSVFADYLPGRDIRINMNLGIAGMVAITGDDIIIPDAYLDSRFDKSVDERTGYRTRSILCVPLHNQSGEIMGVIESMNKNDGLFTDYDLELLKSLSSYVAMFIENALLFEEQNRQFKSVLEVLAASIDAKDTLTAGHSKKVAEYAIAIGREVGLHEDALDVLNVAALLHDYGKLGIDDHVLKKPGNLNREEFEHIKQHVANTRCILNKMAFMRKYKSVPLLASSHHERLDGSGYSEGITDIPFMARILAVADVFEALTAERHYRRALSVKEALNILDGEAGTKLDENVIAALKAYCLKEGMAQAEGI